MDSPNAFATSVFPAVGTLVRCPDIPYENKHADIIFHPLAIYNISKGKCIRRFLRVVDELDARKTIEDFNKCEELLDAYEALLHSLAYHWDDCLSIIDAVRSLTSSESVDVKPLNSALDHHWSKSVMLPINQIKHHAARLSTIVYSDHEIVVPGFYYVAAVAHGIAGPSPKIHKKGRYECSYSLTLRKLFFGMHQISVSLNMLINKILPKDMVPIEHGGDGDIPELLRLCEWFTHSPRCRFRTERLEEMPSISVDGSKVNFQPKTVKKIIDCHNRSMRVTVHHAGDGVTRSFQVPGLAESDRS